MANLNLIELTNRLPLTEKVDFYINKVAGLTQPHQSDDFQIEAWGLGFGQDDPKRKYTLTVQVAGKEVPVVQFSRTPPYQLSVRVPFSLLEPHFSDDAIKFVPISITATVSKTVGCKVFFECNETSSSKWELKMTLLPRQPAEVSGAEVVARTALDGVTKTTSVDVRTEGCKPKKPCDWQRTIALAQNERALAVRYACAGQCGWSYNLRKGGYDPDYDILEGGTKVVVYRHVDGKSSTTVTHYVDYQTLKTSHLDKPIAAIKAGFGQAFMIKLSPENTACVYRLSVKMATGQSTYIDNSMTQSPDGLVVRVGTGQGPPGASCTPSFKLNIP